MRKQKTRALSLFLAALLLWLTAFPAAAESVQSAEAATMQLMKSEGTVSVTNASERDMTVRDNMRLYNGYHVETKAKSYAWVNLDDAKLAKLDAVSETEVRKSGKKLEMLLKSGNLFFNVTNPLEDDETLNIRTSTMVVGIRGTCGWIKVIDRWGAEIYVLEGVVEVNATDPVTGQVKTEALHAGEKAIALAYPQTREGDKCDVLLLDRFEADDIDGFVLMELAENPGLCGDIYEDSGIDPLPNMGLLEHIRRELEDIREELDDLRERFEKEELPLDDAQSWLDDLRQQLEDVKRELEQADPDEDARRDLDAAEEHLRQVQEELNRNRNQNALDSMDDAWDDLERARQKMADGSRENGEQFAQDRLEQDEQEMQDNLDRIEEELTGQENNVSSDPVWEEEGDDRPGGEMTDVTPGGAADTPTVRTYTMPLTDIDVQGFLDEDGVTEVQLLASADFADNTLTIENIAMHIDAGKTLTLADDIDVAVDGTHSLTVDGTLNGGNILTNDGILTVNSGNTLEIPAIINNGVLDNTEHGRIVATNAVTTTANTLTNAGRIEGSVVVTGGTFVMTGGEVVSSAGTTVQCDAGGDLDLTGGTVTNSGTGYAVSVASADDVTIGNTLVQAKRQDLFAIAGESVLPAVYITRSRNGYYYMLTPIDSGNFGANRDNLTWAYYSDGTLTISGSESMGSFNLTFAASVPWYAHREDIRTVEIADGVTNIGAFAFYECSGLTSVTIPDSVTIIENYAFQRCSSLKSVTIPDSVREIWFQAFSGCSGLTSVAIPDSVTHIGQSVFTNCSSLESVTIGDNVTTIGNTAFEGCSSLESVTIPNSVTSIEYNAFYGCSSLESVIIPDSVTSIGAAAFRDCSGLTDVYYTGSIEQWEAITISSGNTKLTSANIHYQGEW